MDNNICFEKDLEAGVLEEKRNNGDEINRREDLDSKTSSPTLTQVEVKFGRESQEDGRGYGWNPVKLDEC